jgi:hypothetical protein
VSSLRERISAVERELETLRQQERADCVFAIAASVGGVVFSAGELLERARFDASLREALEGASSPRQVGRRLLKLASGAPGRARLVRVGRNTDGCIWAIELHDDGSGALDVRR